MISHPITFVFGVALIGFMLPEFFSYLSNRQAPWLQNILCAIALGVIAYSFT